MHTHTAARWRRSHYVVIGKSQIWRGPQAHRAAPGQTQASNHFCMDFIHINVVWLMFFNPSHERSFLPFNIGSQTVVLGWFVWEERLRACCKVWCCDQSTRFCLIRTSLCSLSLLSPRSCAVCINGDPKLWLNWISSFIKANKLAVLRPFIPTVNPRYRYSVTHHLSIFDRFCVNCFSSSSYLSLYPTSGWSDTRMKCFSNCTWTRTSLFALCWIHALIWLVTRSCCALSSFSRHSRNGQQTSTM